MNEPQSKSDWSPCDEGELLQAVMALKIRRRKKALARVSVVVAVVALVVAGLFGVVEQQKARGFNYGAIYCSKVREFLPQFMAGKLDSDLSSRIRQHLAECPHCRERREKMTGRLPLSGPGHLLALAAE